MWTEFNRKILLSKTYYSELLFRDSKYSSIGMGFGGGLVVSRVLGTIPAPSNVKLSYIEPGESKHERRLACSDGRGMGLNLGTA